MFELLWHLPQLEAPVLSLLTKSITSGRYNTHLMAYIPHTDCSPQVIIICHYQIRHLQYMCVTDIAWQSVLYCLYSTRPGGYSTEGEGCITIRHATIRGQYGKVCRIFPSGAHLTLTLWILHQTLIASTSSYLQLPRSQATCRLPSCSTLQLMHKLCDVTYCQ